MDYSQYINVRNKFCKQSASYWLFRGPLGVIVSILLFPVTLIVAAYRLATSRSMSFQAYEDIIDAEVEKIAQRAFVEFGLVGRENEVKTVIITSPCYTPVKEERVLLREVKHNMVQSTCMEVSVLVLEGLIIRIFNRKFSTMVPLYRDKSHILCLSDIISVRKTKEAISTSRYGIYSPVFDNDILIDTAAGTFVLKVNGWRQNASEIFIMLQNGFIEVKNPEE